MKPRITSQDYSLMRSCYSRKGENCHNSKLTDDDVRDIRSAIEQRERLKDYIRKNLTGAALAKKFGVHTSTIEKIAQNKSWFHVM